MLCAVPPHRRLARLLADLVSLAAACAVCAAQPASSPASPDSAGPGLPLRRIADVKAWADWAEQSLRVELEGVVTCVGPGGNFFLQDESLGIHVGPSDAGRQLKPGNRVRIVGATRRGAYAPSIEPGEIKVLGDAPLPAAVSASYGQLASGVLDGAFVELRGVVCDVATESSGVPVITLSADGRRLRATVYGGAPLRPEAFLDAEVRLRGAASGSFNRQRQLVEPIVRVSDASFIEVTRPPPVDPFAAPLMPLSRLLGFSIEAPGPHRVRIQGTVTRRITGRELFVRSDALGLRVETREPVEVKPGDVIDAVGFPAIAAGSAVLESAVTRVVASGPAPAALRAEVAALLDGSHAADLVRVRARLVDRVVAEDAATLILEQGGQLLRAAVRGLSVPDALPEKGSVLDVTAICVTNEAVTGAPNPASLVLLVSDPADLLVVQWPDWWTAGRLWRALGALLVLLGAGLGWVWSLRRQIRRKRAIIEEQARHAAVLEERSRIARDLHDTIEQGLTGLSLHLKVVEMDCREAPHDVAPGLEAARQMLRQTRALAHDAIRELRTDEVAQANETLVAGLERIAESWRQSGLRGIAVRVDGSEFSLPAAAERNLLSIAAEAITNAIKHGHAAAIEVNVSYARDGLRLIIRDNGSGFDPARAGTATTGAFGLLGMRERAAAIGGHVTVQSAPGGGATISVNVPRGRAHDSGAAGDTARPRPAIIRPT